MGYLLCLLWIETNCKLIDVLNSTFQNLRYFGIVINLIDAISGTDRPHYTDVDHGCIAFKDGNCIDQRSRGNWMHRNVK